MPRRAPASRLADIARAACKVFTAKGYRRTLMTDVARELGFSHGVLYRYVAGKEALFQLALLYAASPDAIVDLPTPLPTPAPGETLRPLTRWTAGNSTFPALGAALATDECADIHREFTGVVDELYSVIEDHHVLLALIESSAIDIPELDAVYFGQRVGAMCTGCSAISRCGSGRGCSGPSLTRPWPPGSSSRPWRGSPGTAGTTGTGG